MAPVVQVVQVPPNAELIELQAHELGGGPTLAHRAPTLFRPRQHPASNRYGNPILIRFPVMLGMSRPQEHPA